MTGTPQGPTPDQVPEEVTAPSVSTAPAGAAPPRARSRWHWSSVPDHLGRARTSTVVLCVLFLLIGTLYLYVRPEEREARAGRSTADTSEVTPAPTAPETTTVPETTAPPEETEGEPTEGTTPTTTPAPTTTPTPGSPTTTTPRSTPGPGQTSPTGETPGDATDPTPTAPTTP